MAKVLSRKVTIFINGKEVENTIKSLEAEAAKLRAQQRNLVIGSEEYIETSRKLKEIKDVLAQQKNAVEGVADAYGEARKKAAEWSNIVVGMKTLWQKGSDLFNWLKGFSDEAARMDDVYADVMKTTGLTRDEVLQLNEAFKGMDTRTAREELNRLAAEAGKLGIQGVEGVAAFTEAADKIKVALGEDLGEDATTVIGKMAEVYTRSTKELSDAGDDLGAKMLRIGSAINSLGAASSAAEPHMVDFLARLGGMASQAGLSAQQVLGYASALDQSGVSVEKSATAFQNFMSKMMQKPGEFAAIARQGVAEFRQLMETDMDAAIKAVLAGLNEEGGMTRLAPLFKDLQMAGSGVTTMLTTLKSSIDKVNEAQTIANAQMSSGASIEEEFAVKNNTMQARLDKAKDTFHDTAEALGNALYPAMIGVTNAGSGLMSAASGLIGFLREYPAVLSPLVAMGGAWLALKLKTAAATVAEKAAELVMLPVKRTRQALEQRQIMLEQKKLEAYHRTRVAEYQEMINKEKLILTDKAYMYTEEGLARIEQAEANIKAYSTSMTQHAEAADKAHTTAIRAKGAAMKATPWGLIITGLTAIGSAVYSIWKNSEKVKLQETLKEVARQAGEAEGKVKVLFGRLRDAKEGSDEYRRALEELRAEYPDIIARHVDEEGKLRDLEAVYKDVAAAARQSVYDRMYMEEVSKAQGEVSKKLRDAMDAMSENVDSWMYKFSQAEKDAVRSAINGVLVEISEGRKGMDAAAQDFTKIFTKATGQYFNLQPNNGFLFSVRKLVKEVEAYDRTVAALKVNLQPTSGSGSSQDPFGLNGKNLEELNEEMGKAKGRLAELNKLQASSANQPFGATDYTRQILDQQRKVEALTEAIRRLEEEKKKDSGDDGDGGGNYSGGETPAQRKAREKREREEAAWERFGQNYERLIDKMNAKELTGVDKVVADVDDAIRKMKDDLDVMIKKHPEARSMLDELKQKAESWKRTEIDKYIGKLTDTYSKLADRVGNTEGFGRLTAESDRLRDSLGEIDKAILQAEADLGKVSGSQRQELQWLIDDYKELKSEITGELLQRQKDNPPLTEVEFEQQWNEERQEFEMVPKLKVNKAKLQKMGEDAAKGLQDAIDGIEIEATPFEKWCDAQLDLIENFASRATSILSSINTILDNIGDQELVEMRRRNEEETATLDEQLEQQLISQEEYNQRKKELDDEYNDKEKEIRKEQWVRNKWLSAGEATIEGALAVLKALNDKTIPSTAARIAMAATIGTLTAAQILAITSQPEPYAKGGYVPRRTVYQAGEAGPEWVASNTLLSDPATAPIIEALESYQRGNRRALADIPMAQIDMPVATAAARELGRRTVGAMENTLLSMPTATQKFDVNMPDSGEMMKLWQDLATYLKDPKNRQAVISRQTMTDFERNEQFLRNKARL